MNFSWGCLMMRFIEELKKLSNEMMRPNKFVYVRVVTLSNMQLYQNRDADTVKALIDRSHER